MKLLALIVLAAATALAADPTGKWTSVFDTQIGQQSYTYEFKLEGKTLTGKATHANGSSPIVDGKFEADVVSFVENFTYDGNSIRIEYKGKFDGDDKLKLTRTVGEYAVEEIVANRVK